MSISSLEERIFSRPEPFSITDLQIQGHLPTYMRGSYYLNGPGLFERNNIPYQHWLDGDGIVRRLDVTPYSASYHSAYVMSRKVEMEAREDQPLYRNFGTSLRFSRLNDLGLGLEGNANVSVYEFGGHLLAFGEQTLPYELMKSSLMTKGKFLFSDSVKENVPFSGHPKIDPKTGHLVNFGIRYLKTRAIMSVYEFDESLKLVNKGSATIPFAANVHDFAISEDYVVLYITPYVLNWATLLRSSKTVMDCLEWKPELGTQLVVLRRSDYGIECRIEIPRGDWCLHVINAHNHGTRLFLDLIDAPKPYFDQYQRSGLFMEVEASTTRCLEIDLEARSVLNDQAIKHPWHLDFPSIDPTKRTRPYQAYWALAMEEGKRGQPSFYSRLVRFDREQGQIVDSHEAEKNTFYGAEPAVIPNPRREKDACVVIQKYDRDKKQSSYLFFKGYSLKEGPIAEVCLPEFDPIGFHSSWAFDSTAMK